jgi:2-hydroxy-3-oxopropionate reductase
VAADHHAKPAAAGKRPRAAPDKTAAAGPTRAGFIGLGVMGGPMARHLLEAGFPLTVASRSPGPVAELVHAGAIGVATPADVGRAADVVILMLPDPPDVDEVIFGADGVASTLAPGSVIVDMSTGDPILAREWSAALAERGIDLLDAPVSGGMEGAKARTLSIMVGGRSEALAKARPLLEAMGSRIVHVGASGAGQITKAANQLVVASTIQAVGEALVLAAAAGVSPAKVREALLGGYAASRVLEVHGQRMLDANYVPGGRVGLHRKDARVISRLARRLEVVTPAFDVVADALESLVDDGKADLDHSALVTLIEAESGVRVTDAVPAEHPAED